MGREPRPLPRAPRQAVRDRRVGARPRDRPPEFRPEDGELRLQPPAGPDHRLLPHPERLDVRPQLEAELSRGLQEVHPAAGELASWPPRLTADSASAAWAA